MMTVPPLIIIKESFFITQTSAPRSWEEIGNDRSLGLRAAALLYMKYSSGVLMTFRPFCNTHSDSLLCITVICHGFLYMFNR